MKVAYVTTYDARNPRAWSGLGYFIWRALAGVGVAVELVGPLPQTCPPRLLVKRATSRLLEKKQFLWERSPYAAGKLARRAEQALRRLKYDVILAPDTIPIAYLDQERPVVTWTDATFAGMLGFYPGFNTETIARESVVDGLQLDGAAIRRSELCVYGSDWAARSAIDDLGGDPRRVEVLPFGANVEREPSDEEVRAAIDARKGTKCKLLFLGSDWERKGGPTAVEVTAALAKSGFDAELTVIGCEPPIRPSDANLVKVVGFLDKTGPGARELERLLSASHFLILPAHAECFGLPLCEASAFGVPSLATEVGGIPTVVRDSVNGALFDPEASPATYATYVERMLADWSGYRALALEARAEYRRRLNWTTAASEMKSLLLDVA